MTLFSSLTNRIFLASALLAIVTIGLAMYLVSARVTREAEAELERGLMQSGALVEEHRRALSHDFLLLARLVADLPKFKAAVETQDAPTVRPIAEDYRRQLDADLLLVTDRRGALLFGEDTGGPPAALPGVADALKGREAAAFWPHPHGMLEVVTVPIAVGRDTPEILGTLSAGFLLDDRRAGQFKRATASEIAFAADGRIRGATLPSDVRDTLAQYAHASGVSRLLLGGEEFMMTGVPLSLPLGAARSGEPRVLVLRSRAGQLRSLRAIRVTLLGTAALAVLLATVLSYAVARSVTRPLGAITAAMRDMAATGDLTRRIALRGPAWWKDEDALLLASTFNTLIDSLARFQRETAQRERLLALGRLSTVIAHEVRNPLMIIKAALRSLGPETPASELREAAADIDEQVGRLNRIVHDVLDFARPLRFELAPANLADLCESAATAVSSGEAIGAMIAVHAEPHPIVTDAERVRSALVNVLANAVQAVHVARAAGPAPPVPGGDVVLTAAVAGGIVRITVRDHGGGIAPEHAGQMFEPYFTTRRTGTGLGLPITRNIIEGLGGTISVRPERPGTTVEITLPTG